MKRRRGAVVGSGPAGISAALVLAERGHKVDLYEAAAATGSLVIIFWGVAITLPLIAAYSVFVYRVFGGKATELRYD